MNATEQRTFAAELGLLYDQIQQGTLVEQIESSKAQARQLLFQYASDHSSKDYYLKFTNAFDMIDDDFAELKRSLKSRSKKNESQQQWLFLLIQQSLKLRTAITAAYQRIYAHLISDISRLLTPPSTDNLGSIKQHQTLILRETLHVIDQSCNLVGVLLYLPYDSSATLFDATSEDGIRATLLLPTTIGIVHDVVQQGLHKAFITPIEGTADPFLQCVLTIRDAKSGCVEPIWLASQHIGMLAFLSKQPYFNEHAYDQLLPKLAQLIASCLNTYEAHIQQQQSLFNDHYMVAVSLIQDPSLYELASITLATVAQLCTIQLSWGQLWVMKRQQPIVTNRFTLQFAEPSQTGAIHEVESSAYPSVPATILRQRFISAEPILITDIATYLPADELDLLPYRSASLFIAPLYAQRNGYNDSSTLLGMLVLGSDTSIIMPSTDLAALQRFSRILSFALEFVAALDQRQDEIPQLLHDMSKVLRPLENQIRLLNNQLELARTAPDQSHSQQSLQQAYETGIMLFHLAGLAKDLLFWSDDYSNNASNSTLLADEVGESEAVTTIVTDLKDRIDTFAAITTGQQVRWLVQDTTLSFQGGRTHANLISSVLFKFLENAIKFGQRTDITVTFNQVDDMVRFAVTNQGTHIPEEERGQLFTAHFRGTDTRAIPGSGFGLAQAAQIADLLHGQVGYVATDTYDNTFWLQVPLAPVSA